MPVEWKWMREAETLLLLLFLLFLPLLLFLSPSFFYSYKRIY